MREQAQSLAGLMDTLGLGEEPMGMFYTDVEPAEGHAPKPAAPPSVEAERKGEVDWGALWGNFSCVVGTIWLARRKRTAAYFEANRFGCLGGSFYLGFHKPQLDFVCGYVSTGTPGGGPGERYLASPEVARRFFTEVDPRPAPARFCVFKPVSAFGEGETPEVVVFFARPEAMAGLHQLATFVTGDFEAVASPFGAGCTNLVTWPLHYLAAGRPRAVLGGWDPSDRKFLKTDELTLAVPLAMYRQMLDRWPDSFLTTDTWQGVRKKVARSREAWKD